MKKFLVIVLSCDDGIEIIYLYFLSCCIFIYNVISFLKNFIKV